jgi:hypothetical protein
LFAQKEVFMSPARHPNGSPGGSKIARQPSIDPALQEARNAMASSVAAKKKRDFDPRAFLVTIGEGGNLCFSTGNKESLPKGMPLMQCFISRRAR